MLLGRRAQVLEKAAQNMGNKPWWLVADVTKAEDCKRAVDTAVEKWRRMDVLINNAVVRTPSE